MTTANKLTLLRVALIPVFLIILYLDFPFASWAALAVFIIASLTDMLDGYIARHYNQVTDFGKFMDPLADKMLVMAAMCWFVERGAMYGWVLALVLLREFAVSGMRLVAVEQGRVIAAAKSGKIKTFATMVCLCLMLAFSFGWLNIVCQIVILVTTLYSGVEYFVNNKDVFRSA
ncbi:MAG: CDP-diacylglycerol--glycerol-3-phosphate 3-phosphatidyltransferase [Oscillospiraceae bacterium]|nr:CDP-diacylglycerol--glycerol-3-phosphate 3-phosphatidyltransferase [Oscillospiraceae bacterium]